MTGNALLVLRVVVLWTIIAAIGMAFVVWLYAVVDHDRALRTFDEVTQFSMIAWLLAPVLHWLILPREWERPEFMAWTLAVTGMSIFAVFMVQLGLMFYTFGTGTYLEMDIDGFVRFFDDISYFRPSESIDVPAQAAFGAAQAAGYTFGMAMISWRLAATYVGTAVAAGAAIMLWPAGVEALVLPLSESVVAMGPGALGPNFYGGQIVLSSFVTGTVALAGTLGILVWALALRDREPLLAD